MHVELPPLVTSTPRLRRAGRGVAIALTSLLVLAACQSTATIELSGAAPVPTATSDPVVVDGTAPNGEQDPDADAPTPTPTNAAGQDGNAGDAGDAGNQTIGANFELRGELPLSTAEVNDIIAYIEGQTGRDFLHPPVIVAQSEDEFFAGLADDLETFASDSEVTVRTLQALGLTTSGVAEVAQSFKNLLLSPDGIRGYYDPIPDELYVPVGSEADDEFRISLVHELTHALDGQHTDLTRLDGLIEQGDETGNYEPYVALLVVIEGRATAVQNQWMADNDVSQEISQDLGAAADVPPAMLLQLGSPYVLGEQFVLANGGPAGTWGLLLAPPASSEAFLVTGGLASDEVVIEVQTPDAEGPIIDEGVFGAIDVFVWLLGESLEPDPALILPTFTAIDGWAGGRSVLWGDDSDSCIRIALAADNDADLAEFEDVISLWVRNGPNRSVETERGLVVVTGCAPYVP